MLAIILSVLIGLAISYFAIQNTAGITITLANYPLSGVPLYLVVIAAFLLGLLISWIISMVDSLFTAFTIRGKENTIQQSRQTIGDLKKRIHDLELENAKLRGETEHEKEVQPRFQNALT